MESECAMFKSFTVEMATLSYSQKIVGACGGGNMTTHWWTSAVNEAVRLKEEDWWQCNGLPRGLVKQQTGTNMPEKLQLLW